LYTRAGRSAAKAGPATDATKTTPAHISFVIVSSSRPDTSPLHRYPSSNDESVVRETHGVELSEMQF
jgi:hypothetical protein